MAKFSFFACSFLLFRLSAGEAAFAADTGVGKLESLIGSWSCSMKSAQFDSSFRWILEKSHIEHEQVVKMFGRSHEVKEIIGWNADTKSVLGRVFAKDWTAENTYTQEGSAWRIEVVLTRKDGTKSHKKKILSMGDESFGIATPEAPLDEMKELRFTRK